MIYRIKNKNELNNTKPEEELREYEMESGKKSGCIIKVMAVLILLSFITLLYTYLNKKIRRKIWQL
jgi:hypothetical protein